MTAPAPMMTAPAPMMTARVITTILRLLKLIHTYIVVMTLAVIMGGAAIVSITPRTPQEYEPHPH